MAKKNFTISTVVTAPSPATTGTSLVVASGDGALFAVNEPAIVFPVNNQPLVANAEIVMVTNVATDTLTITRTQESTSARTIVVGDIIIQGITAKDWNDLITAVAGKITAFADPNADRIVFWDDSAGAFAALTASTGLTLSGTTLTVRSASTTQTGIVELATTAETETGIDTARAVTPDGLHDMATLAGAAWMLDEDNMASDSATKVASQQSIKAYVDARGLDGWIPVSNIYPFSFTLGSTSGVQSFIDWDDTMDLCSYLQKGMKITWTQNSVQKYAYIIRVEADAGLSYTETTLVGDLVLNTTTYPVTNIKFSMLESPFGFPTRFSYTPTIGGFSANPNMITTFSIIGRTCIVSAASTTNGTSNATTYTMTLPVAAATITNFTWRGYALVVNNNVALDGNWSITSGSATLNFFDAPLSGFTNSGNKSANAVIVYEI
ncbi:MAG: hypothetical protein RBT33_03905 [Candidatus Dojkabacteria bacterium]|jgi:hypothetical protein|nr:hypothetical protein [Candidatus Dojkabacteria bacterium]